MEKTKVPAAVTIRTSDGSVVQGKINLGQRRRISDVFTKSEEPFVVLYEATYSGGSGKVLVINKDHILWIEPEEGG
jgi:hypothetical protein